ncbi:2-hydroxyglutaryl-CoA dehydratase [Archaeoglobales archaeon ex4484_92]|nr:MAG: 2-hydroxyglutaryl-CoA dehydratase [Archaeoglobales archaeon ex4484_92]
MIVAGLDIGSLTAKCVLLDDKKILSYDIMKVKPNLELTAEEIFNRTLEKAGINSSEVSKIVATGYGRKKVGFANRNITEISCHARGAVFLIPTTRTIIDIGGQDSKVIAVGPDGSVREFVMNDKCAAGTGRFLEVMANALNVTLQELPTLSKRAKKAIQISSTCTVFAESEVIGYLASGEDVENIVAGIHNAIASRIAAMANRIRIEEDVVLTGGVAKNEGVKIALENALGLKIKVPFEPQIVGALGAALFAFPK